MFVPLHDEPPTRRFAVVTAGLILANCLVFVWELSGRGANYHVFKDGYYPCTVSGPCHVPAPPHPLPWYEGTFSAMFMHAGWLHIAGNMLFLWIFGNNVEDSLGRVRFFFWYIGAGLAAAFAQTFVTLQFSDPVGSSIPNIGASGAIAGVLGAYLLILPDASVLTVFFFVFFFIVRQLPAYLFLGIWFIFQLWEGGFAVLHPQTGGGVAFFAHIGGFAFGALTVTLVMKRRPLRPVTQWTRS